MIDDSNLQPASLYLGGKKVATESTVGEGFDIDAITENLAEGGNYSYFIRAQGSNGEDKYTVSSYLSPNNVQGFTADSDIDVASTNVQVTAQGAKQASDGLSVLYGPELPANNVSKIKLIPTLADASLAAQVSYEASFDGGATWQPIAASQEYLVQDELGQSVQIRATFNSAGVAIKSWNVQITSLNLNDSFIVQLVTQAQRPTAMSMVNYSIWLRWDGILGDDETYSVYRGTTPDFEPDLVNHTNRIFSGLTQNYIYDIDVTKDQTH